MIKRYQHSFGQGRMCKKLLQIIIFWKPEERIHYISLRPQCNDLATTRCLFVQIFSTAQAHTCSRESKACLTMQRRQVIPFCNLQITCGNSVLAVLQYLHLPSDLRWWHVRWMESREPLITFVTSEMHHVAQNRMHSLNRTKRCFT